MKKRKSALLLAADSDGIASDSLQSPARRRDRKRLPKVKEKAQEKTFISEIQLLMPRTARQTSIPIKTAEAGPVSVTAWGRRCFVFQIPWKSNPGWPPTIRIRMS